MPVSHISSQLTELVGSRICHDLISPLGAISNGVELMSMSGGNAGPEMSLISESVENANARIRYFRIAFGAARAGQQVSVSEINAILRDLSRGGRLVTDWQTGDDPGRPEVKLAFLLLQCFETAMPWGGRITVTSVGDQWAIHGEARQMKAVPELWQVLNSDDKDNTIQPANVHFPLARLTAENLNRSLTVEISENSARVRF
ncbi:MAG: histidine phosphotransferase family protein [Paracoccaceae bacterium]